MIGQIWRRLQLLFAHGEGLMIGADKVQARVLDGETLNNIVRVEPYGYSYRPKAGSELYLVFPDGDRSYGVALVIGDKRYQMELEEGECGIHDDEGNWVHIKRGGIIEAKAATKVIATTPLFETSADALIGGNLVVKGMTNSNAGFYGEDGGAAECLGGLRVTDEFKVNGKDVSDSHTHTGHGDGAQTSGVT